MGTRGIVALLVFLSIAVFLPILSHIEVISGHEAREGLRLYDMLESRNWLFSEALRKPPLYYWISGIIAQLRGGTVDAVTLRLPSALLAGGGVLVVLRLGQYAATPAGGTFAGLILLTSLLYVQQAHSSRTDMALCFFVTLSLLLFFSAYTRSWQYGKREARTPYLFALSTALALLSKGPVGVLLIVLPIAGFLFWRRHFSVVWFLLRPGLLLTFGVLGCGWYGWVFCRASEEFWYTQVMEENLFRLVGGIDVMSPFYYVGPLVSQFVPWIVLLPFALWRAIKEKEDGPVFLVLWWVSVVLFFQVAAYKRARYLLPAQPASALLVGWWLATRLPTLAATVQQWRWWQQSVLLLAVVAGLASTLSLFILYGTQGTGLISCQRLLSPVVRETPTQIELYCHWVGIHFWIGLMWWSLFTLSFFCLLHSLRRIHLPQALSWLLVSLLLVYTALYPSWLVVTSWAVSSQPFVSRIVEKIGPERSVTFISPSEEKGYSVVFALRDHARVTEVRWPWGGARPSGLTTGYYLVTEERRAEVTSQLKGAWSEVLRDTSPLGWPLVLLFYEAP